MKSSPASSVLSGSSSTRTAPRADRGELGVVVVGDDPAVFEKTESEAHAFLGAGDGEAAETKRGRQFLVDDGGAEKPQPFLDHQSVPSHIRGDAEAQRLVGRAASDQETGQRRGGTADPDDHGAGGPRPRNGGQQRRDIATVEQ
ncbi:hypothetical protein, partial [Mycobacterium ulcerans]